MIWANSPFSSSYESLWHTDLAAGVGSYRIEMDLRHWINEGLMTLFFLVVGLEVKRELLDGELRHWRAALLPIAAAVGGMLVPALLYFAVNSSGPTARGWAIPMATDVALAIGLLTFLGSRIPGSLRAFLLTLAIVDDMGAVVVIAFFFADSISMTGLGVALLLAVLMVLSWRKKPGWTVIHGALAFGLWLALLSAGIHATIAGVLTALATPVDRRGNRLTPAGQDSVAQKLQTKLHPWVSFAIVPVFALANAGVNLGTVAPLSSQELRVGLGIALGLVLGKTLGITLASWAVVRAGIGQLPSAANWRHIIGVAAMAGIGFTVSLFFADLAFETPRLAATAKAAVLVASILAAGLGTLLLRARSTT